MRTEASSMIVTAVIIATCWICGVSFKRVETPSSPYVETEIRDSLSDIRASLRKLDKRMEDHEARSAALLYTPLPNMQATMTYPIFIPATVTQVVLPNGDSMWSVR